MWHPSKRTTRQMEEKEHIATELAREDDKRWRLDGDESTADSNVDSGFLSSGNLLISGEIRDTTSGLQLTGDETERGREVRADTKEQPRAIAPTVPAATLSSSSSSSAKTIAEPMRADSGLVVDIGLSESLSQLTLRQVALNPLSSSGTGSGAIQVGPSLELSPLIPSSHYQVRSDDVELLESQQRQRDDRCDGNDDDVPVEKHAVNNDEPWQLYYMQDDDGDTQLHIAIVQGFMEAAFNLIRMAPYPWLLNCLNDDWQSPLHLAVLTNQPTIIRRLILAGADPTVRNFRGNTSLHVACLTGDLVCAKALTDPLSLMERNELMREGRKVPALPQDLEQRNYNGETCLHVATVNKRVDLMRLLLRLGADLEARERLSGMTPLHVAVEHGCHSVISFLLHECKPRLDAQTYRGWTAYQLALCFNDNQLARELVRYGARPEPLSESSDSESGSEDEETLETSPSTATAASYQTPIM